MSFDFLVETYETERVKILSVWAEFRDEDLAVRPRHGDPRGRSVLEQMVHQCVSEDLWFRTMLGIDVGAPPLPRPETRVEFIKRYAEDSGRRLAVLREKEADWWGQPTKFFDAERSRAWVMLRRLTHSSPHRGQLTAMLRIREYLAAFNPTFLGATGNPDELEAVLKAYGVVAQQVASKNPKLAYEVDHSSFLYLVDRQGKIRGLVPYGTSAKDIAHDLESLLKTQT